MKLSQLGRQDAARVVGVQAPGPIRQRLMDMGFLPDAEIRVERVAPAGEPLWIRVCGAQVALRRVEAEAVDVVCVEGDPR